MDKIGSSSESPTDAEAIYNKATRAELSRNYDLAFKLYIKAAELYLHLSRTSKGHDKIEAQWKANAGKALQRAEKIKAYVNQSKPKSGTNLRANDQENSSTSSDWGLTLTPIGIDHFSKQEQFYVLKKGGSVNGLVFPLWDEPVALPSGISPSLQYQDPDGQPKLSPEQARVSLVWCRPKVKGISTGGHHQDAIRRILPQEILQHIVTDCSVCASISVCLEHARRFGSNLAEAAVYNLSNRASNSHRIDPCGGYDLKVFFNGAWRRITVDDKLPYHPTDGTLMCMSVLSPADGGFFQRPNIWPSILEKGYMKLMGGYDFPGSNSSIDLHAIAGWIPEHIEIKGPCFEREKSWERVLEGFQSGHCVLTLGTGKNPNISWRGNNLLASHSYAVINITEENALRTFAVLDTWVNPDHKNQSREASKTLLMPWTDVLNVFDGIYLSWDPTKWPKVLTYHDMWKRKGQDEESSSRQLSLHFDNRNDEADEEIWILLTRHVADSRRTLDFISLKIEVDDDLRSSSSIVDQIAIAAKGNYTNSSHVLVRTRVPLNQRAGALTIFTSYDGDATEVGFTLTAYASASFVIAWDQHVSPPPFVKKIDGVLTNKNAGGNCTYPTFMLNPQYHLRIHPPKCGRSSLTATTKTKVALTMQTSRDIPANITLVWSQGGRINELVEKELAGSSGAYGYGLARVTKEVSAGDYTVIVSAFEPHHMGSFSLKIECSRSFDIKPILQEDAGMYTKVTRGAWNSKTAGGSPTSDRYSTNPIFEIDVPRLTQLRMRLQLLRPSTATSLNVTIFPASTNGSFGKHIATSGAYNDAISGVATPQISLRAGKYWAVPSTYNAGVQAGFQLILHTTVADVQIIEKGRS
ncbi:hypothetical protein BDZ94DRAFT_1261255 [Collybia nuda]|uniref:Calpain catalytic domain-containing protein n=1 Tax=Collybia nuda TaxID=64659 RepID=A0A9P5Y755_9AGAR|nr:hypothetical protein BDZ94DRAFT_1261255 [Collybia nuda]